VAKLWIVHREGLRLLGTVVTEVPLETAVARLDIAPWRLFTGDAPEPVTLEAVHAAPGRKRALLEVREEDRYELCGLSVAFYESPYSPDECLRRLNVVTDAATSTH
jgi:hypothetical protein